jgi:hypothetical protein
VQLEHRIRNISRRFQRPDRTPDCRHINHGVSSSVKTVSRSVSSSSV